MTQNHLLQRLAQLDRDVYERLAADLQPTPLERGALLGAARERTDSQVLMHQLTQSAICSRFHTSVERLARWLLMTAERAGTNRLALTHEGIAQMVGAPRSAVTAAAAKLRRDGILEYRRGVIVIKSAKRLRKNACECFNTLSFALKGPKRTT